MSLIVTRIPAAYADGKAVGGGVDAHWTTLHPASVRALSVGTEFKINGDGSILVVATNKPDFDRYVVRVENPAQGITGFRLEALGDASLPHGGPGLESATGNFILGEFSVRSIEK